MKYDRFYKLRNQLVQQCNEKCYVALNSLFSFDVDPTGIDRILKIAETSAYCVLTATDPDLSVLRSP